jgi:hypothetical protein
MQEQIGLRVALGKLLVAVTENAWQMRKLGHRIGDTDPDQRLVQRDLPRRRRQQILAAQHVGDLHQRVVDRIDQGVQRITTGAGDREVRHHAGGEGRLAAHQINPGDVLVGHLEAQHGLSAFGLERGLLLRGEVAVVVVVAQLGVTARRQVPGLDLFRRRVRLVNLARGKQFRDHVAVEVAALRLPVRLVGATDLGALVPVQPEPAQGVEDRVVALLAVARGIGVLDAEDEVAAGVARVRPVEERGADQADVRRAGRRRTEANPDRCGHVISLYAQQDWRGCRCHRR